jgi:hypothetical protein
VTNLYRPLPMGRDALTGLDRAPIQPEPPTELNYGLQPQRVLRPRTFNLRMFAGLMQWQFTQWFYTAYLPPLPVPRVTNTARAVGGVMGAGTVAQATSHVPSARVPRSIT